MTSSKVEKVTVVPADINAVNPVLAEKFIKFIKEGLSTEAEIWETMVADHLLGLISVRGMKETIGKVNAEAGSLPSVAVTGAQYFASTVKVRNLEGGKDIPLKDSIGVATQGERKFGKAIFQEKIAEASTYSDLAETVEKQPAKPKAEGSSNKAVDITDLDGLVTFALDVIKGFQEGDDAGDLLAIKKIADAESLVSSLQFFIRNAKATQAVASEVAASIARHPAKGSKVKA